MSLPLFAESGDLCRECGACCMDITEAPVTLDDLQRLMTGFNLTMEQARAMTYSDQNTLKILVAKSGACPSLSHKGVEYTCNVYEHRPEICRSFQCFILYDLREWHEWIYEDGPIPAFANVFFKKNCRNLSDARSIAFQLTTMYKTFLRWPYHSEEEKPDYFAALEKALGGDPFENTFPPK